MVAARGYRNSKGKAVKTLLTPVGELLAAQLAGALPVPAAEQDDAAPLGSEPVGRTAMSFSPRSWQRLVRGDPLTPETVSHVRRLAGLPPRTP